MLNIPYKIQLIPCLNKIAKTQGDKTSGCKNTRTTKTAVGLQQETSAD